MQGRHWEPAPRVQPSSVFRACRVPALVKPGALVAQLLSSSHKLASGPMFTAPSRRRWPWFCESRARSLVHFGHGGQQEPPKVSLVGCAGHLDGDPRKR